MNPQEIFHISRTINVFNILGVEYRVRPHIGMPTLYLFGNNDGLDLELLFSPTGMILNVTRDGRMIRQINSSDPYELAKHFGIRVIE